jgi:hypothetical protein
MVGQVSRLLIIVFAQGPQKQSGAKPKKDWSGFPTGVAHKICFSLLQLLRRPQLSHQVHPHPKLQFY